MKIALTTLIAAVLATLVTPHLRAGTESVSINPALLYYQAFLLAPAESNAMSATDLEYLHSREGLRQPMPARFDNILAAYDDQFRLVKQAAQSDIPCDWGIDFSDGPATLLPALARAKAVAVTTRFRVRWHLEHDRQADARDEWLASLALSRNVARDGTLISSLVQMAMEAINYTTFAEQFGKFSSDTLQELSEGIDAIPQRWPIADCIPGERAIFEGWLLDKIAVLRAEHPDDDAQVMQAVRELFTESLVLQPVDEDTQAWHEWDCRTGLRSPPRSSESRCDWPWSGRPLNSSCAVRKDCDP